MQIIYIKVRLFQPTLELTLLSDEKDWYQRKIWGIKWIKCTPKHCGGCETIHRNHAQQMLCSMRFWLKYQGRCLNFLTTTVPIIWKLVSLGTLIGTLVVKKLKEDESIKKDRLLEAYIAVFEGLQSGVSKNMGQQIFLSMGTIFHWAYFNYRWICTRF